jgi:isoamylase
MDDWARKYGVTYPFGANWNVNERGYNFSIFSKTATRITLELFEQTDPYRTVYRYEFDPFKNKTNAIWHCFIPEEEIMSADCYAYRIDGPNTPGNYFNFNKLLLDPWAKAVFFPADFTRDATKDATNNTGKAVLGRLLKLSVPDDGSATSPFPNDLVIYEIHVKGFSQNPNSGVSEANRGTFLGIIELLPHLRDLGITAVELLPVHQFDIMEDNYWGYMTLNFFAPHNKYCTDQRNAVAEFKQMVKTLHEAGIQVILDVIYNHTSEGGLDGPFYNYKGIDNSSYYLLSADLKTYVNDAGTGNVMRTSYKTVRKLILDSLRYWASEMNVDGFRFDLASIFTRNDDATINLDNPPILEEISMDPVLCNRHLIAEPWDTATYQLGSRFPGSSWKQWNGAYRDDVRKFVKGESDMVNTMRYRMGGSSDFFPDDFPFSCHPFQSVNFVTSHDGFTLYDTVAYNEKHNEANGHNNADGSDNNFSWNCGTEGDLDVSDEILNLRKRQVKNFFSILMLSNGIPMFRMGDEFFQTQAGNNNAYNQDNVISWLDWSRKTKFADIFRFVKMMIAFRNTHRTIWRPNYWKGDASWFGVDKDLDTSSTSHSFSYFLEGKILGDDDLYVMVNAFWQPLSFRIQVGTTNQWKRVIDTSLETPNDILPEAATEGINDLTYSVAARSLVVLVRSNQH